MGLSLRAYAAHRKQLGLSGTSDTAVRKALAAGRIRALPDGTIDAKAADRAWAGSSDQSKVRGGAPISIEENADGQQVLVVSPTAGMDEKTAASLNQVKVAREKVKLAEDLDNRKLRKGELMERAPARKLYFELGLYMQQKWATFPDVEGPGLAAKFGAKEHDLVQDLKKRVDRFIVEMIEELKDPLAPPPEKRSAK